jgi:hypothetical protein
VLTPVLAGAEAVVVGQRGQPQRVAEPEPHPRGVGGDDDVAPVPARERPVGGDAHVLAALQAGHLAAGEVVAGDVAEQVDLGVEHRDVDPGPGALVRRAQHPGEGGDSGVHPGAQVADRQAGAHRLAADLAGERHAPAQRLDDHVERRAVAVGPVEPEAGERGDDQPRVQLAQHVRADAELLHRAGPEVLHHRVGRAHQPQQRLAARVGLQVDADALLVAVHRQVVGAVAVDEVRADLPGGVAVGRLDLDHTGAEVAEDLRGERAREVLGQVDHHGVAQRAGAHGSSSLSHGGVPRAAARRSPVRPWPAPPRPAGPPVPG